MANKVQPSAKEAILNGTLDLSAADLRFQLIDVADYTYNSAHNFMDDVAGASKVGPGSPSLAGKTFIGGVFDAADILIPGVTGDPVEAGILYEHTGSSATDKYIAYIDTFGGGMPLTPTGAGVQVVWNASGIFQWGD